jgi:glycosyltransferase involved in cell wall biosynthesis
MVTTFYPPYNHGGDGIFVQALARALTAEGHQVEVVHCEDAFRLSKGSAPPLPAENDGIVVHRLGSALKTLSPLITQQTGRPALKAAQLRTIFARDFDVVNFHNISLVGGPGILSMSQAKVNLYTLHEHWLLCPMHIFWKERKRACDKPQCIRCCIRSGIPPQLWRYGSLIRRSLAHVDALLSPSEYTAQRHRQAGITTPITTLPSFSRLSPEPPSQYQPPAVPTFLFAGRVTASKGIQELLECFTALKSYRLIVLGDGDLRLSLQDRYANHRNICFKGAVPQSELETLYQSATATILPSLAPEVLPLSVLESFACGTPVIVRNAGGAREPVDRTGAGFIYETREEFFNAVHKLATDGALRERMGRQARKGYGQYYTKERYLASYLALIDCIRSRQTSRLDT